MNFVYFLILPINCLSNMEVINRSTHLKLLKKTQQWFAWPDDLSHDYKVANEPYSYWIGATKMYVFDETETVPFLMWRWQNEKNSFILDIFLNDFENSIYKYFCENMDDFKTNYPLADDFTKNIIETPQMNVLFEGLVCMSGGIERFIAEVIVKHINKLVYKIKNIRYAIVNNECKKVIREYPRTRR